MTMRLAVLGATGRMGRAVVRLASEAGMDVVCAVGLESSGRDAGELAGIAPLGLKVTKDLASIAASKADVLVDFSSPAALAAACLVCASSKIAIVSGTTGLGEDATHALDDAAKESAVLWEPNMSVGVHVLAMLVERAANALDASYDVEIVEAHHRAKVDAPSGTALRLADVVNKTRKSRVVHGREGRPGPRTREEIGMHAIRGGNVVGDHTVAFLGDGERLELTHRADSRDLFARGALRAARWIVGRANGRYALSDVLGF